MKINEEDEELFINLLESLRELFFRRNSKVCLGILLHRLIINTKALDGFVIEQDRKNYNLL